MGPWQHTVKCMELILLKFVVVVVVVVLGGYPVHEKFALVKVNVVTKLFQAVVLLASTC